MNVAIFQGPEQKLCMQFYLQVFLLPLCSFGVQISPPPSPCTPPTMSSVASWPGPPLPRYLECLLRCTHLAAALSQCKVLLFNPQTSPLFLTHGQEVEVCPALCSQDVPPFL